MLRFMLAMLVLDTEGHIVLAGNVAFGIGWRVVIGVGVILCAAALVRKKVVPGILGNRLCCGAKDRTIGSFTCARPTAGVIRRVDNSRDHSTAARWYHHSHCVEGS